MFEANNVIQPCILCSQPVTSKETFFCDTCSIFKDKARLEAAVQEQNGWEQLEQSVHHANDLSRPDIAIYDEDEDECEVVFDVPE